MEEALSRTAMLLGEEAVSKLKTKRVIIFGIGGVGGYVAEALARSGVGNIDLVDKDCISVSNINRQIIATTKTVGRPKVSVMKERILEINPSITVNDICAFYLPANSKEFDFSKYDYVVDAVDTVTAKVDIIMKAKENNVKVISSMGAGNKLDPTAFKVSDIYKTDTCPLAKTMRHEMKKRGVKDFKVVYSTETPVFNDNPIKDSESGKMIPGSIAFIPSVCGLIIAGEVIKDLALCD